MTSSRYQGSHGVEAEVEIQHSGPSILSPVEVLHELVEKSNDFISEHRIWLAGFPQGDGESSPLSSASVVTPSTSQHSSHAMITTPPVIELREASPAPQINPVASQLCEPLVAVATSSLGSMLSVSVASSVGFQLANFSSAAALAASALSAANSQIALLSGGGAAASSSINAAVAAAQSSASLAVAAAQSNVSSANAAADAARSSAASASSLVTIAQAGASSASVAAAAAQSSANQILSIANSVASDAKGGSVLHYW